MLAYPKMNVNDLVCSKEDIDEKNHR
jgi:hypothetical protein